MKKMCTTIILLFMLVQLSMALPEVRGITEDVKTTPFTVLENPAILTNSTTIKTELPNKNQDQLLDDATWFAYDSLTIQGIVEPNEFIGVTLDNVMKKVSSCQSTELSEKAKTALELVPKAFRCNVENNFTKMATTNTDLFADIIINADIKFVDEIAFVIGNTPIITLESKFFNKDLLLENVQLIYQYDEDLQYVELVESEDGLTTVAYKRLDVNGAEELVTVPYMEYYWYVVHPKLSDEIPAYINPDVADANLANIANPPTGKFWRSYLYTITENNPATDTDYPILKERLANSQYIWNDQDPKDSTAALRIMTKWINDVMSFDSKTERPHQPIRIYKLHLGRCGEHEDLTNAVSRLGLIPCRGISSISTDHVWNEFWDKDWEQWEPVNNSFRNKAAYGEHGWGKMFGTVYARRSDGLTENVTDQGYCDSTATINLHIVDKNQKPIDGAAVLLAMAVEYDDETYLRVDSYHYTDAEGNVEIKVGHNNLYYARVDAKDGRYPAATSTVFSINTEAAKTNETFSYTIPLDGVKAYRTYESKTLSENKDFKLEIEYSLEDIINVKFSDDLANQVARNENKGDTEAELLMLTDKYYDLFVHNKDFVAAQEYTVLNNNRCEVEFERYHIDKVLIYNNLNRTNSIMVNAKFKLYLSEDLSDVKDTQDLTVFPVPCQNNLNIITNNTTISNIEIYNQVGALQFKTNVLTGLNTLDVSQLTTGMYFIKFNNNGKCNIVKFIKE